MGWSPVSRDGDARISAHPTLARQRGATSTGARGDGDSSGIGPSGLTLAISIEGARALAPNIIVMADPARRRAVRRPSRAPTRPSVTKPAIPSNTKRGTKEGWMRIFRPVGFRLGEWGWAEVMNGTMTDYTRRHRLNFTTRHRCIAVRFSRRCLVATFHPGPPGGAAVHLQEISLKAEKDCQAGLTGGGYCPILLALALGEC